LAAKGLVNIQKARREPPLVDFAAEKLLEVCHSTTQADVRLDAGEILSSIGDHLDFKEFIAIKGGIYQLGEQEIEIEPFELGKYPVTNQWYAEVVKFGGYQNFEYWTVEGQQWLAAKKVTEPRFFRDRAWNRPNAPVVGVCWYEAWAFVAWLNVSRDDGYRYFLPNEQQWWAAAAGKKGREYPWKGDWRDDACNIEECGLRKTSPVGYFQKARRLMGLLIWLVMFGNGR